MVDGGAGVPLAAGVLGAESVEFSPFTAGRVLEVAEESLVGESSLTAAGAGSNRARSFLADTFIVTKPGDEVCSSATASTFSPLAAFSALSDLRRSFEAAPVLLEGGIVAKL